MDSDDARLTDARFAAATGVADAIAQEPIHEQQQQQEQQHQQQQQLQQQQQQQGQQQQQQLILHNEPEEPAPEEQGMGKILKHRQSSA